MLKSLDRTAEVLVGNGRFPRVAATGAALLLASGVAATEERQDPATVYLHDFSGHNRCLEDTPFDVEGSKIAISTEGDSTILSVSASYQAEDAPEQLRFTTNQTGLFGTVELVFADSQTASYVVAKECPGQPDGY